MAGRTVDVSARLGSVDFQVSCNVAAQREFNTALTLLHSFWYDKAETEFDRVAASDHSCAMAHWGVAMSRWHELWAPPDAEDVKVATAAIARAQAIGAKTDKERRFIAAIASYYHAYNIDDDTQNRSAYASHMRALHASYPSDRQVALFYALALIADAPPRDPTFANQRAAGAILEPIFAAEPNDPGAAHYIIHAFDDPTLAARALHAAREYAKIAPAVPHALHMPSHTFTDLGLWEDSIASNRASLAAEYHNYSYERLGSKTFDDFHSTDFLSYADLQAGRVRDAQTLAAEVSAIQPLPSDLYSEFEYTLTLSRVVVERRDWKTAARFLVPGEPFGPTKHPGISAIEAYVRGLGDAYLGDVSAARSELGVLDALSSWAKKQKYGYLARYLRVEHDSLSGWIDRAGGQNATALSALRSAAAESTRSGGPPLIVWPAPEQLGTVLLELHRPAEARAAFAKSLHDYPNRLKSLSGAAEAATATGDRVAALNYYRTLADSCPRADSDNQEVAQARAALKARH